MKDAIKFGFKAFFGGCLGCLGVISVMLVFVLVLGLIFGPQVAGGISTFLQSIPNIISQGLSPLSGIIPGMPGNSTTLGPVPPMEVYLTIGDNPNNKHVITFSTAQTKQIYFWVKAPKDAAISFTLLITQPDKTKTQFGPEFKSDPSGKSVNCGQIGVTAPSTGNYKLEVIPNGTSTAAGSVDFKITG
jgi:hypothetical protein